MLFSGNRRRFSLINERFHTHYFELIEMLILKANYEEIKVILLEYNQTKKGRGIIFS